MAVSGCALIPSATVTSEKETSVVFLELIDSKNAFEVIRSVAPEEVDRAREDRLVTHCGGTVGAEESAAELRAYSTKVHLSPVGQFTGENLLRQFAALWSNKPFTTPFYRTFRGDLPALRWRCFRLVRAVCRQAIKQDVDQQCSFRRADVHMDLVGEFRLDHGDALKVRPLRLYYRRSMARSNESMGVAIEIRADASWREMNVGHSGQVFNTHLLDENLTIEKTDQVKAIEGSDTRFKYYRLAESGWDDYPRLPIIPWSTRDHHGTPVQPTGSGHTTLTFNVAEVGHAPGLERDLNKFDARYGHDMGKLLLKATKKALEASAGQ